MLIDELFRTNKVKHHPVMASVFDNMFYHHGSGSNNGGFRTTWFDKVWQRKEKKLRMELLDKLFFNTEKYLEELK